MFVGRWKYVKAITVIPQTKIQVYFSYSLDHPHYSVHPIEYQSYLVHLKNFQKENKGMPEFHLCDGKDNHELTLGLSVTNIFPHTMTTLLQSFPLQELTSIVQKKGKDDEKRGTRKIDTGFASAQCQTRRKEWHGLPGPNQLKLTSNGTVKATRKKLYQVLKYMVPNHLKGKVYKDDRRAAYFDFENEKEDRDGVHIQSFRVSLGRKFYSLSIHRDSKNDNTDPFFSPVLVVSWVLHFKNIPFRLALITYSRKFVSQTLQRIDRYGPAIVHLSSFYNQMKSLGEIEIKKTIFDQDYKKDGFGKLSAARITPHVDPCVHWSSMGADALLRIKRLYNITAQQGLALLYSVSACNSPDYFRVITNRLIEDKQLSRRYFKRPALQIAVEFYEIIYQFKTEASRNKQLLPGQRHPPSDTKRASRGAVTLSVRNLIKTCTSLSNFHQHGNKSLSCKADVHEVYLRTMKSLCNTTEKGGLHGTSPPMVDKIIKIGSLVGLFPLQFLLHSTIHSSTKTYQYLETSFGLDDHQKDPYLLLDGLAFMTNTNQRLASGICNKAAQAYRVEQKGREVDAVDTIYPEMCILSLRIDTNGILVIDELSKKGINCVDHNDLIWESEDQEKIPSWGGYWMGCFGKSVKRRSKPHIHKLANGPPAGTKQQDSRKRKVLEVSGEEAKVMEDQQTDDTQSATTWTPFNYPSQMDIVLASLRCRYPFHKWKLLAMALGKGKGVLAGKSDITIQHLNMKEGNKKITMFTAHIQMNNGSCYYPPTPRSFWDKSGFNVWMDGKVYFPKADTARRYTLLMFLLTQFRVGLETYLKGVLNMNRFKYVPQRLKILPWRRDPQKLVIFHDNDTHGVEPMMAVCMQVNMREGAFALVDDFGKIIQESTHRFQL